MGMSRAQIEKELKEVLLKIIDVDPQDIKPHAHFFKDLGIDSIKALEIMVVIEKHFKIQIKEDDIAAVTTLAHAVDFVEKCLERKA